MMKRFLILLILNSIYTFSDEQRADENCTSCRAILPNIFYKKNLSTLPKNSPCPIWIEIIVEDGVDIFQLALKYYGDREEYKQIYLSNQDIIGEDLQIVDGMSLKIPITQLFEEQPMILNRE
jgi:hypothetical protein